MMGGQSAKASKRSSVFQETANSIKRLRQYSKGRTTPLDMNALNAELDAESDRACIILMANFLDDTLKYRLSQCLSFSPTATEYDRIFRSEGPLGTFSGRMEIACLFGFIDDSTYKELDIIRELRGACAHYNRELGFSDPHIANVTRRLFRPLGFIPSPPDNKLLKTSFLGEGIFLFNVLYHGCRDEVVEDEFRKFSEKAPPEFRKIIQKFFREAT
jgi:hypothetical protein